ncbi:MAG: LysE family translocator [Aquabacterium sp.]
MSFELWLVYLVAAVGLSFAPGPNGLLALTHGARFGLQRTLFTVLGGALGFLLLIAVSLAGMGALLAASERGFMVAKMVGAAYLAYLGLRLWRAPAQPIAVVSEGEDVPAASGFRLFVQGFLVAATNPKGIVFFAAFLPQFIVPGVPFWTQLAIFGGTFVVVEVLYEAMLAALAQRIAPWLSDHTRWFNRVTGGVFVAFGVALANAHR